jgi:membrane protein DedA with SNARE-associated domain
MDLAALVATPLLAYLLVVGLVALDATFPAIPSDAFVVSTGALAAPGTSTSRGRRSRCSPAR